MGGGKTEISLDEATNEISVKGVNVLTTQPAVGDIVCYDENRKIRFITCDTFHAGTFPSAWETVGVVVIRKGNQVTICSKTQNWSRIIAVYPYIVSGYTLDGAEHTATLKLHGSETKEFRYTATTDAEFLSDLKNFLTTNGFNDWSAYIMDGKVILQYDNYDSHEDLSSDCTQATGIVLTPKINEDRPGGTGSPLVMNGYLRPGLWNIGRAKEYFVKDNSNTVFNPSSDVSSMPSYPVCWPAFAGTSEYQEDHCLWLRQQYCKDPTHPKKEEWEAYLEGYIIRTDAMTGGTSPVHRSGKRLSDEMKDVEYQAADGRRKKLYPASNLCLDFMGKGYVPSISEWTEAFRGVTYGLSGVARAESDPVNRSLYAIGGAAIPCTGAFPVANRTPIVGNTYLMTGDGYLNNISLWYSYKYVPFADLDLTEI